MRHRKRASRAAYIASAYFLLATVPAAGEVNLYTAGNSFSLQIRSYRDIPFRTVVRQQYDYSCGSAALATLLHFHYGRDIDEATAFKAMYLAGDQAQIKKVGFSLLDMKTYLETVGVKSDGFRISLNDLGKLGLPAITVISLGAYKHFVVIKGVTDTRILVGDPATGLKIYTRAEFEKIWNGIAFLITDEGKNGAFNVPEEWSSRAGVPLAERMDFQSLFGTNVGIAPIYQITQLTPIQPVP